ncbi:carbon storage regulator CsrA [Natranaerofaba carboxydovora]|uniref:carbon storage regulator CsrA n=1 Tax=Natranaerofaba carboxydovora TaxID=2742683 RepID=UPI001F12E457|nr:carbon storage regulator CsrA [Natranaerofaba carboxydovora]UMZ74992.1 Carbon storage regulator [Natranaerofaba carboxydovora]
MLVLSRKEKESIIIGDDIEITLVKLEGDRVKVGIKAPKDVEIHRKEVYEKIQGQNIQATKLSKDTLGKLSDALKNKKNQGE